jgi:hypothetical protein
LIRHASAARSEEGFMQREPDGWNKTFFDRVIQANIGQVLKAQYDHHMQGQPFPRRLAALLKKIDEHEAEERRSRAKKTR